MQDLNGSGFRRFRLVTLGSTAALLASVGHAAIAVQTSNFITAPTAVNGFEKIASSPYYDAPFYPTNTNYSEGGITTRYVGFATYRGLLVGPGFGDQGSYGWYPDGGGLGYTKITLTGGKDFSEIQFLAGTGAGDGSPLEYRLLEKGVVVDEGIGTTSKTPTYFGFSGGGFDEVDVQDNYLDVNAPFNPVGTDALTLDNIAAVGSAVPEPETWALMLTGLAGLGTVLRRKIRTSGTPV